MPAATSRQWIDRTELEEKRGAVPLVEKPKSDTNPEKPIALKSLKREATKKCPYCAETIKAEANVCRFCGADLITGQRTGQLEKPTTSQVTPTKEVIYYRDDRVTITSTRAILRNETYAMANITSVSARMTPPNRVPSIILLLLGLLLTLCMLVSISESNEPNQSVTCLGPGVVMLIVGVVLIFTTKASYSIRIGSASGEANALTSTDKEYVNKIVAAMHKAIIGRG